MANQVRVWVVEANELRGTGRTCIPNSLPNGATVAGESWFDSADRFAQCVKAAFEGMLGAPDVLHLLIISAHGKEGTGTQLEASADEHFDLRTYAPYFAIRPEGMVVLVSACWGGYQSVLEALQAGNSSEPALVVAPLVRVAARDINALQAEVIATMAQEDAPDEAIESAVARANKELFETHAESVFRLVRRDGTMIPPMGGAGLAAPMEEAQSYRVVAVQRLGTSNGPPETAVLLAPDGKYWRAASTSICLDWTDDALYALPRQSVTFRCKKREYDSVVKLGDLVEVVVVPSPARPKAPQMPNPPYSHSMERISVGTAATAREIGAVSLRKCKRCNWASYSLKSARHADQLVYDTRAICHRTECDEHAKWRDPA